MKNGAPSPYRVMVGSLNKIQAEYLAILFTGVLICGDLPKIWKKNTSILIPKLSSDLGQARNWRLLTISSVFKEYHTKQMVDFKVVCHK